MDGGLVRVRNYKAWNLERANSGERFNETLFN